VNRSNIFPSPALHAGDPQQRPSPPASPATREVGRHDRAYSRGRAAPNVLGELVERASHGYERWAELVTQAGYCHHPIRLAGRIDHADRQTGEIRTIYDSDREPDGVLLKACGTRREPRCHTREAKGRLVLPYHPYRQGARCPHGNRAGCWHRHDEDDPRLGEPLCAARYDAEARWPSRVVLP
jgi:hypothetical protein